MDRHRRELLIGLAAGSIIAAAPSLAAGGDRLRLGKSVGNLFVNAPIDVAMEKGFFAALELDVEVVVFNGAAKMYQGLVADAIDLAFGSGPGMINILRGVPAICIAQTVGPPVEVSILVPYDSATRSAEDLKGKRIGITTVGGVTEWMVHELARVRGWGAKDVTAVAIGGNEATVGALKAHTVDAVISESALGFQLEQARIARPVVTASEFVGDFVMHTIYASNRVADGQPAALRKFLVGWFEAVAFMRRDKPETMRIARQFTGFDDAVESREYDLVMPVLSDDGRFDRQGLARVARSFVELGMLKQEPDMTPLYTERFLPTRV
jgi:ABC-type nitrate/sulfonate/bicarbonate transport system substrate-binding protein